MCGEGKMNDLAEEVARFLNSLQDPSTEGSYLDSITKEVDGSALAIKVQREERKGRYAVATKHISVREHIIHEREPIVAVSETEVISPSALSRSTK